ncbi:MAG TPA: hypothetical protein VFN57_05065 [Thermomicrobiaceae bacterium]|nr:hypothetical protein [Thermomicrobiaceae bacterium]
MVPSSLHDFFMASAGASAALIGLLFVAVSIAPERVFGSAATGDRTYRASSAFFVLANGLFISLGGLMPRLNLGIVALVAGLIGAVNTVLLVVDLQQQGRRELRQGLLLAAGSLAIYVGEAWSGVALLRQPGLVPVVDQISYLVLGSYVIGLARAWELVGGRYYGLVETFLQRGRVTMPDDIPDVAAPDASPETSSHAHRRPNPRRTRRPRAGER